MQPCWQARGAFCLIDRMPRLPSEGRKRGSTCCSAVEAPVNCCTFPLVHMGEKSGTGGVRKTLGQRLEHCQSSGNSKPDYRTMRAICNCFNSVLYAIQHLVNCG